MIPLHRIYSRLMDFQISNTMYKVPHNAGVEILFFCLLLRASALRNQLVRLKTYLPESLRQIFKSLGFVYFMRALHNLSVVY